MTYLGQNTLPPANGCADILAIPPGKNAPSWQFLLFLFCSTFFVEVMFN
jgi:hypothetical protein